MLNFFRRKPIDPPTAKQAAHAKKLGITVTPKMSKSDVSNAIASAENANPKLQKRRAAYETKQQALADAEYDKAYTPEVRAAEKHWGNLADSDAFILAVYRKGKETVVDALQVYDTDLTGTKKFKLKLLMMAPKLRKDKYIGDYLEWEREFSIPFERLLHYELLPSNFENLGIPGYQRAINRGLKTAKRLL